MEDKPRDKYAAVREALRRDDPLWEVEHCDITCDGCEREPIVGHRFKCCECEDIDLCGACMRALVAARVKMSQEAGPLPAPRHQGGRPRRWVHKLRSKELAAKWAALQTAVPCLHPSHRFLRVIDGPERAVVFHPGDGAGASTGCAAEASAGGCADAAESIAAANDGGKGGSSAERGSGGGGSCTRLERFLATFPPSAASCSDVAWIVVAHPGESDSAAATAAAEWPSAAGQAGSAGGSSGGRSGDGLEERVDAAVEEWERLTSSGRRPSAADVDALAAKHRILKGKWMLFARTGEEADAAWAAVARAVCGEPAPATPAAPAGQQLPGRGLAGTQQQQQPKDGGGQLPEQSAQQHAAGAAGEQQQHAAGAAGEQQQQAAGAARLPGRAAPLCRSAKVSSASPDGSWVICLYTDNYQDRDDVDRVCTGLRAALPPGLLQDRRLLYKPDILTHLGIYSRNEWQIKPTIAEARLA